MKILSNWLRSYLPALTVSDRQLADDLTLRGIAVEGVFELNDGNGSLFEMDITTNRVDAMNHYGVAREAAAIYDVPLQPLDLTLPSPSAGESHPVRIEAKDLCGRFTAQVIRGVTVKATEGDIASRFAALGQKPISNAVDITNYTWLAMGHPTHVFDLDKLEGGIVVRTARKGETIKLLDGSEKVLEADDLVIADEKKALGLAGVMGGWDSRVTEETKNILVEAAWFDPSSIRRSSRRHGLHTDASHRFERGADIAAAPAANALVSKLLIQFCGGTLTGAMTDVPIPEIEAKTTKRAPIALAVSEVQRLLGSTTDGKGITACVVEQYLRALGCVLTPAGDSAYAVTLPSWRLDLEREIDLIEEVARVYGYNRFENTLPSFSGGVVELPYEAPEQAVRSTLLATGFTEAISSTFASEADSQTFAGGGVPMGNPLNEEAGNLRPSLLPGMVTMLATNLNRDVNDVRLYEMGTRFTGSTAKVVEEPSLSLGATGGARATAVVSEADALFYELKGALEKLFARFRITAPVYAQTNLPSWVEPGRGAIITIEGQTLAVLGELASAEAAKRKLRQPVWLAEVNLAKLFAFPLRTPVAHEISRYQAVERDFSFIFPDAVTWAAVETAIHGLGNAELLRVAPQEIFRDAKGKAVAAGHYSLLTRVVFQSQDRTLRDEELAGWSTEIIETLEGLGGKLRA
ncbi:MAG: phenylalanine--tRNA ligase subunit beta [Acidobacteriaceae bacterium]|nr:phenylalanine--tRNA ligase subunit beta [Acidobacteriaceae bacterium]